MRNFRHFTPDEDAPLLISWHRGDLSAFETLIWKYQKRIFNLTLLLTGAQKSACEATENSFLTAFQNIRTQKGSVRFSSWLVTIALNECREFNDYRPEGSDFQAGLAEPTPDESNYSAAMNKKLALCIRALPVELGELILLRYVRGYSLERIEEILKISGELLLARLFEAQCTLAIWLKSTTDNPEEFSVMKTDDAVIHPEIQRNFSAYLDSSIKSDEKEHIKNHLKNCGSCRKALAELEWMIEDIKSLPDAEPPHWLAAVIMQKVKSTPGKTVRVQAPSQLRIMITVAILLTSFIGISSYLLLIKSKSDSVLPRNLSQPTQPLSAEKRPEQIGSDFTALFKGVFKGSFNRADTVSKPDTVVSNVPLPPAILPSEPAPQAAITSKLPPLIPTSKIDSVQKNEKVGAPPTVLPEWGDAPAPSRSQLNKVPLPRTRSGELAVALKTVDPVAAGHDIENAVTSLGGKVNGRAYNGGNDLLYTRVEVDRFFELMSRLEKIGVIQELPQLPDGAEGALELTIRW